MKPAEVLFVADLGTLTDLLEVQCLRYRRIDLRAPMRAAVLTGEIREDEEELRFLNVAAEIQRRIHAAGDGYPFSQDGRWLSAKSAAVDFAYSYCLLLLTAQSVAPNHRKLFEELCGLAMRQYLGGSQYLIGVPRRLPVPSGFRDALDGLARELGEGNCGNREKKRTRQGDGGVDIVGWAPFRDKRPGQIILLGNCATGRNWRTKIGETHIKAFCSYFGGEIHSHPIKAMFVCEIVADDSIWIDTVTRAGILFDRARIASLIGAVVTVNNPLGRMIRGAAQHLLRDTSARDHRRRSPRSKRSAS